ncbi:MAG: right-handed parallel beta-helix repeat-containing protein [Candidatus Hodarchaeales archaeon]
MVLESAILRNKHSKILIPVILTLGFVTGTEINIACPEINNQIPPGHMLLSGVVIKEFIPQVSISITSDAEFVSYNFPGSGVVNDPYRIEGFNITSTSDNLISIVGTTAYFLITNNMLNGLNSALTGISFLFVDHGTIVNNTIENVSGNGIHLDNSHNNTIRKNVVYANHGHCLLISSNNNSISGNVFSNSTKSSVNIRDSHQNQIFQNSFHNNHGSGLQLNRSRESHISNNFLYENNALGISLVDSNNNNILNNYILNNTLHGIGVDVSSQNNIMKFNAFLGNNAGLKQASDDGIDNIFLYNNWEEWDFPDVDSNNLVDIPYSIGGLSNQQDLYPLVRPPAHLVAPLVIVTPYFGEALSGTVSILWIPSIDTYSHPLFYSVFYSSDAGENWTILASNITENSFIWETVQVRIKNPRIIIKVIGTEAEGLIIEDSSEILLTIENTDASNLESQLFIILALLFFGSSLTASILLYSRRKRKIDSQEINLSAQIKFLKGIYHKIIIGIENIRRGILTETRAIPLLKVAETEELLISVESATTESYFSPHIRDVLTSDMKGRTVLVLIEISYQYHDKTHPTQIAKSLNIPLSTLLREINKLIESDYIEPYTSPQVLKDGRFRNYSVTPRGLTFLDSLKDALAISIDKLREKNQGNVV